MIPLPSAVLRCLLLLAAGALAALLWASTGGPATPRALGAAPAAGERARLPVPTPPGCPAGGWQSQAPYPIPIAGHAVAALGGRLYSFGGFSNGSRIRNAYRYDPATNSWTRLADLPAERASAGAVSDGRYLYILGGVNNPNQAQNTLYRYDPATDSYAALAPALNVTVGAALAYLDGRIYRISGCTFGCPYLTASVDAYEVEADTWAPVGSVAPYPVSAQGAVALGADGYLYAGGGHAASGDLASTYRYDPATNQWSDSAVSDLPDPRLWMASGLLNGRWILAGGRVGASADGSAIALDLAAPAGSWVALPRMPAVRLGPGGAQASGAFYAVGGTDVNGTGEPDNQQYQETPCPPPSGTPPTATATRTPPPSPSLTVTPTALPCAVGAWAPAAPYPIPIQWPASAAQDGRVYSFGGSTLGPDLANAYVYDPARAAWAALNLLPRPRRGGSAVSDGRYLYLLNGFDDAFTPALLRYDPQDGSYTALAAPPLVTMSQAAVYLAGKIYRIAGQVIGGRTASVDVYTIATDTWAPAGTVAPYPLAVELLSATAASGYIYAAGGVDGDTHPPTPKTFRYDPATNTWSDAAVTDLPSARAGAAGGVLGGRWVLAGGFTTADWQAVTSVTALDLGTPDGAWLPLPPLLAPRMFSGGASSGAAVWIIGGQSTGYPTSDLQAYTEGSCPAGSPTPSATGTPGPPPTATATASATPTATSTATPVCGPVWQPVPPPPATPPHRLVGISALNTTDTWAVGAQYTTTVHGSFDAVLLEHWDGAQWTVFPGDNPGEFGNRLNGVVVLAPNNAWAVGDQNTAQPDQVLTLIEHWDGTAWHAVPSPNPVGLVDVFEAIAAVAANDIWAVGYFEDAPGHQGLLAHWDGAAWSAGFPSPLGEGRHELHGVAMVSATDGWAVGACACGGGGTQTTVILRWTGTRWDLVPSPNVGTADNVLTKVVAVAPADVWAVGYYRAGSAWRTLIEHWDGSQWSIVPSPNVGAGDNVLNAVGAIGPGDLWAVGAYATGSRIQPLTLHWDGTAWSAAPTPLVAGQYEYLYGVSGRGPADVWAVGYDVDGGQPLLLHYGAVACPPASPSATPSPATATMSASASASPTATAPWATASRTVVAPSPSPTHAPSPVPPTATPVGGLPSPSPVPPSATGVLPTSTAPPCAITFRDVQPTDYFYVPVQYLACHGVISGYANGTFRPYASTTRAQMVKIVVLGFGKPITTPAGGAYTFADVPPPAPFWSVIETAAADNIVSGYACGGPGEPCDAKHRPYFRPNAFVTRGQLAKIVVVAATWALRNPASPTFADVAPGSAFYPFVETAVCRGVISGYADHTFRPGANATRGQIAKIVDLSITAASSCSPP
jgi:N-acetylneuraminic acid mutarotase